jgi:hypothetical protein|tara:strand:- start:150 stop:302 length:153 start_codon:yes stop_codon:yes gene_type:complete
MSKDNQNMWEDYDEKGGYKKMKKKKKKNRFKKPKKQSDYRKQSRKGKNKW